MHLSISNKERRDPGPQLVAIKEFAHYLTSMEKDLSRVSKKLHTSETAQSARLVRTGILEARHYLEIVKKVIEETQRAVQRKSSKHTRKTSPPSAGLKVEGEVNNRTLIETWKGVEIWQGKCDTCHMDGRIAFDGTSYLCVDCLKKVKPRSMTEHSADTRGRTKKKSRSTSPATNEDHLSLKTLLRKARMLKFRV